MTQHRIGIDLGGTKIEIVALAPDGSERFRHRIDTPHGYDATLASHRHHWCVTPKRNSPSPPPSASASPA